MADTSGTGKGTNPLSFIGAVLSLCGLTVVSLLAMGAARAKGEGRAKAPTENGPTQEPAGTAALSFGLRLRALRERGGHSQREYARYLHVDDSTIARIELGTRKPPRDVAFYERLRDIPDLTDEDIVGLLRTSDAPRWLIKDSAAEPPAPVVVASVPDISVAMHFHITLPGLDAVGAQRLAERGRAWAENWLRFERDQALAMFPQADTTPARAEGQSQTATTSPPANMSGTVFSALTGAQATAAALDALDADEASSGARQRR